MPLVIDNVKKAFGEKQVLTGINLTLQDGGVYCLMAPSGMGKTTLLRIILGRETPDSGKITGIKPEKISAMFQEDRLVPTLSAVENVALVCKSKKSMKYIAKDLKRILPENSIFQPISQLSGGMKRRVALARAMHYPGKLVILDEPFTGLDQNTRMEVISYILDHRDDRILLVATHGIQDAAMLGAETIRLDDLQNGDVGEDEDDAAPELTREQIFASCSIFAGIPPERCDEITQKLGGFEKEYGAGEVIWHQYENHSEMGIVLSGGIQAADVAHREPQIIRHFEPGSAFGEAVAFGTQNSWVEIRAVSPTKVLFLPVREFLEKTDDPDIVKIAFNLLTEMSDKLNFFNLKTRLVSEPRVRSRVMLYFNTLKAETDGWRQIPFTQKDLAMFLSLNRSALNRELGQMSEEGILKLDARNQRVLLLQEDWLRQQELKNDIF